MSLPYLSIVATSRNDDHGGNALWRTQHFIDGLAAQANKFEIPIELILVDWNPPKNKSSLYEAIKWPKATKHLQWRVIQVPQEYHNQFKSAAELPLFQYIAKNIGIKRATGKFILATNIDILFSNELMHYLKNNLKEDYVYRVTRFDIEPDLPETLPFQEMLQYIKAHIIRVNTRYGTIAYQDYLDNPSLTFSCFFYLSLTAFKIFYKRFKRVLRFTWNILKLICSIFYLLLRVKWDRAYQQQKRLHAIIRKRINKYFITLNKHLIKLRLFLPNFLSIRRQTFLHYELHTNACGDFTLMSKKDWHMLRGYPEFEMYSWHIDSVLLYQAHFMNIKTKILPDKYAIYHIEHGQGSGWTPEGENILFDRLKAKNISFLNNDDLHQIYIKQNLMKKQVNPIYYNYENWGGTGIDFEEDKSK